jgi:hypothetical protein
VALRKLLYVLQKIYYTGYSFIAIKIKESAVKGKKKFLLALPPIDFLHNILFNVNVEKNVIIFHAENYRL